MTVPCEFCHGQFKQRKPEQRFCCRHCLYVWMHEFSPQKKPREIRQCQICACSFEEFVHKPRLNCSQRCYHKSRVGSRLTIEHRKIISETRKRDWANGTTYANANVGRTKWHDHIRPDGVTVRLQGTWEVLYAKYLDSQEIAYIAHKGALWYLRSSDSTTHVYLPDFYLININEYVDVKNDYLFQIDRRKLEDVRTCNPTTTLRLVLKMDLINLGLMV